MRGLPGRLGDRHGAARLLAPAVIVSAAGRLALVPLASPVAVVLGMAVFGVGAAGFGPLIEPTGYPAAFALTACVPLAALTLVRRERGTARMPPASPSRCGQVELS